MTDAAAEPGFSRLLSENADLFGLSRPAALCFGAIWRAAQAPSADELVAGLGISRSNVSTALKELRQLGLIQAARHPGSRRDFFMADPDAWMLLRQVIQIRQQRDMALLAARLGAMDTTDSRVSALAEVAGMASAWMADLAALSPEDLKKVMSEPPKPRKKKKDK